MEFKLKEFNRNIDDKDLIDDIKKVAQKLNKNTVSISEYDKHGKYDPTTIRRRFNSWNNALKKANLKISMKMDYSNEELFDNLKNVWSSLGRQPKQLDMRKPLSSISVTPYIKRFDGWYKALGAFIDYINQDIEIEETKFSETETFENKTSNKKHRTKRDISGRLRFRILLRDGFSCKKCGKSPLRTIGVELHVDHIIPWSKGGETISENLETKCKECNLGKGGCSKFCVSKLKADIIS